MIMKNTIFLAGVFSILCFGCVDRETNYLSLESLMQLPMDSLTTQQREIIIDITNLIAEDVKVVDNKLVLEYVDFEKRGLPNTYYDQIVSGLNETNYYIDSLGIDNFEEIFHQSVRDYQKNRDDWFKIPNMN